MDQTNQPIKTEIMERLGQIALNPTHYGDDVEVVFPKNGGLILTALTAEGEPIVLDPDQVERLSAALSMDPQEASDKIALMLVDNLGVVLWPTVRAMLLSLVLGGVGGYMLGAWLFP